MKTIVVNTTADVVNAHDGVTSLREAIAQAHGAGPTVIDFATKVFDPKPFAGNPKSLVLTTPLKIGAGETIVIDGGLVFAGQDLTISGGKLYKHMLDVTAGANVTLRNLRADPGRS